MARDVDGKLIARENGTQPPSPRPELFRDVDRLAWLEQRCTILEKQVNILIEHIRLK